MPYSLFLFIVGIYSINALQCMSVKNDERKKIDCPGGAGLVSYCFLRNSQGEFEAGCSKLCVSPAEICRKDSLENNRCCCKSDFCNKDAASDITDDTEDGTSTEKIAIIVAILAAVILLVGLVVLVVYIFKTNKRMTMKARAEDKKESATTSSQGSAKESPEQESRDETAMLVIHEDRTDHIVPIFTEPKKLKEIKQAAKSQVEVASVDPPNETPQIVKIITFATSDTITLRDPNESRVTTLRENTRAEHIEYLMGLLAHGPQQYPFRDQDLRTLLETASKAFQKESSLLDIPVPCIVYGDIHGQYSDLFRWFNLNGWPHQTRCLFLGDFVDRGSHGVEVVALLSALKLVFPDSIFIIRGNHEEELLNKAYSFHDEVSQRFPTAPGGKPMYDSFKMLFGQMPLAAVIGGRILGMHGGLSPKLLSFDDLRNIVRPIDEFEVNTLACDLVWSDPDPTAGKTGFRPNLDREPMMGIGQLYAPDTVDAACDRLDVDMIIRGHQAPLYGYALFAGGKLITLFSAPGYKGVELNTVNMGASIDIDEQLRMVIKQIRVTEEYRKKRIADKRSKGARD